MKITALLLLLTAHSASAFVAPARPAVLPTASSALQGSSSNNDIEKLGHAATTAAIAASTLLAPLAAIAEDDYEYGAVNAPGGIGLAVGLGVVAILTAAIPVVLAPGEDAFNEMKERDGDFSKRGGPGR
mmetsp:Transcript_29978/g.72414  ORF Transcript_29978/g.72414 Transcript_29978/m.72414 type:complete len:129 (+) Transcript_29978:161-547(+)|eukprot:CAMPEP_0181112930 /NCGR_PEP_ID=MMETSP1071-20121207/20071_1 /TAXON_ID=35127 /ORGANISM="Thalassiosira sp., Strain NH16" /LENGTH=128 /DNA_ID=CAMNT_0023196923 /DNA_START=134 /DNA_END=523 /DNA_ORIENTATION=+